MMFTPVYLHHMLSCLLTIVITINYFWNAAAAAETRIAATSPVNPVDIGAIFAFHCQVWNLKEGQEVTLIRKQGTQKTRMFLNDFLHVHEDRVFLALRQMSDGSTVYFLSIMHVTREDEGEYTCKVTNTEGASGLPYDVVTLRTLYFPSDSDPKCSSSFGNQQQTQVYPGTVLTLNCTSQTGNPGVEVSWHNSQTRERLRSADQYTLDGTTVSVLRYRVNPGESRVLLVCQITSVAFPDKIRSCHMGPFTVIGGNTGDGSSPTDTPPQTGHHDVIKTKSVFVGANSTTTKGKQNCEKQCSVLDAPVMFWVIATIVAILIAVIFFVLVLTLVIRYKRMPLTYKYSAPPGGRVMGHHPTGKIYDEIQRRQIDDRVYMSLVKLKRQNEEDSSVPSRITVGRYDSP